MRAEVGLSHGEKTVQDAAIAYVLAIKHGINNDINNVEAYSIIKAWAFDNSKDHLATWFILLESLPEETFL